MAPSSQQPPLPHEACSVCGSRTNAAQPSRWMQSVEKAYMKLAVPIDNCSRRKGCESFVPQPLEDECAKAARILVQFSTVPVPPRPTTQREPQEAAPTTAPSHHPVTIPPAVLASALAIAVLTTGRLGVGHISGSTGAGLIIKRRADGLWGLPAAVRTVSVGGGPLAAGVDVTDRVYVLSTPEAVDLFMSGQLHLGPEAVLALGPHGGGAGVSFSARWPARRSTWHETATAAEGINPSAIGRDNGQKPNDYDDSGEQDALLRVSEDGKAPVVAAETPRTVQSIKSRHCHCGAGEGIKESLRQPAYCYMRSCGLYAGLQGEGTFILDRPDANGAFYGVSMTARQLLDGEVAAVPARSGAVEGLWGALREAERGATRPGNGDQGL